MYALNILWYLLFSVRFWREQESPTSLFSWLTALQENMQVDRQIVAFYEGDIERRPLAKALGQYVPAFMVPNVFRQVESMPLTKNGKIDRKALTAMYQEEKK